MKKLSIYRAVLILMFSILFCLCASARSVYVVFENFEDGTHSFTSPSLNGSTTSYAIAEDSGFGKVLKVTQTSGYADAGIKISMKADVTYSYSYKIKPVSFADGTAYTGNERLAVHPNILFSDSKVTNCNHQQSSTSITPDGSWHTVTGTYTPKSSVIASDADLENARFGVYINPTNGKNHIFMIDDVKFTYTDNEPDDGVNHFKNGSFEDTQNIEMKTANGTSCTITAGNLDASDGTYSIKVSSAGNYGHIGIPILLEEGRTYEYSYDYKLISDYAGNAVTSAVKFYTNFVFTDSKASSGRNHLISSDTATSSDGWHHMSGTYTPSYDTIASDSDLKNGWFTVYTNPTPGGGAVWLIDNVVLRRKPLEAIENTVELPNLISDNMLIQAGKPVPVWGTFASEKPLTIALMDEETTVSQTTVTPSNGRFDTKLPAVNEYYKSLRLVFTSDGKEIETVENVAVGELWHFSGQSNMASLSSSSMPDIIPSSDMPDIRYFGAGADGTGTWYTIKTSNISKVSAVAYKTLETMYEGFDRSVPVGGINTAVGGKAMASYMGISDYSSSGGDLYKSRIVPLTKIPVKGHFWYQGESDTGNTAFVSYFEALITSWRTAWNDSTQPFIFVQLPRSCATIPDWWGGLDQNGLPTKTSTYNYSRVHMWQYELYQKMKNNGVGMVVTVDTTTKIEEQKSIENMRAEDPLHPLNKAPIGIRLGKAALNRVYEKTDVKYLGPIPENVKVSGKYVFIKYSGVYGGLSTNDGNAPAFFEIIDSNGTYHTPDKAEIVSNDTVMIYSDSVSEPAGISYFYEEHFVDMSEAFAELSPNFINSENLPAAPFTYTVTEADKIGTSDTGVFMYSQDSKTAFVNIATAGEYIIAFADYENSKLSNIDLVSYTAAAAGIDTILQDDVSFTLGTGDKILVWSKNKLLIPVCENYVLE